MKITPFKQLLLLLVTIALALGGSSKIAFAQTSPSVLYVPLIGITSVPDPLALPVGAGNVTYHYAVKNFLTETPLTDIRVTDDNCTPVIYVEGDDNHDSQLDYSETWRYTCTIKLSVTTQSTTTVTGKAGSTTATHKAFATVVVGSNNLPPLVSIVNITKVAYPLSLPAGGGDIAFTYRVNNPGVVPLSDVSVTDDKCGAVSGKLGDTNSNSLLDINEVWIYTCSAHLTQTTTNTAHVTAFANGLKAVGEFTITVKVATASLPDTGPKPGAKLVVWEALGAILAALIVVFIITRRNTPKPGFD